MRTQTVGIRLVMALLGNAALFGLLVGGLALAADPNFNAVSDILGGRRSLLRIDDVVVVDINGSLGTTAVIPTSNTHMSSAQAEGFSTVNNTAPAFSSSVSQAEDVAPTALGRMLNVPRDVFVSLLLLSTDNRWHFSARDVLTNTEATATVPTTGALTIGSVSISPSILLDQKAKIQVQLRTGTEPSGATLVAFHDGEPRQDYRAFDVQHIAALRANDTYQSRAFCRPQTCGARAIYVVAGPATSTPATASATVQVTVEPAPWVDGLTTFIAHIELPLKAEGQLLAKLALAQRAFEQGHPRIAADRVKGFIGEVEVQRGSTLTDQQADLLIGQAKQIIDCV